MGAVKEKDDGTLPPPLPAPPKMVLPTEEDMKAIRGVKLEELPWLPPPPSNENRFIVKMKENPIVPLGCLATVGALSFGLLQFKRGNHEKSQLAMKLRVLAQGGTVFALVIGALWSSRKQQNAKRKK